MNDQPKYPSYPGDEPQGPPPGYQPPPPGYQAPPPGYQPPPPGYGQAPPPGYGQAPPPGYQAPPPGYGQPGYGPPPGYGQPGPSRPLAGWWSRVGATIIDSLIAFAVGIVPIVGGAIWAFSNAETDPITDEITGGVEPLGVVVMVLGFLIYLGFSIWNTGVRQGKRGQSLGKQALGIQVIKADTGQFLGGGMGFVRMLLNGVFGNLCFLNYLWPLWDANKQTWHDMVLSTVVTTK